MHDDHVPSHWWTGKGHAHRMGRTTVLIALQFGDWLVLHMSDEPLMREFAHWANEDVTKLRKMRRIAAELDPQQRRRIYDTQATLSLDALMVGVQQDRDKPGDIRDENFTVFFSLLDKIEQEPGVRRITADRYRIELGLKPQQTSEAVEERIAKNEERARRVDQHRLGENIAQVVANIKTDRDERLKDQSPNAPDDPAIVTQLGEMCLMLSRTVHAISKIDFNSPDLSEKAMREAKEMLQPWAVVYIEIIQRMHPEAVSIDYSGQDMVVVFHGDVGLA